MHFYIPEMDYKSLFFWISEQQVALNVFKTSICVRLTDLILVIVFIFNRIVDSRWKPKALRCSQLHHHAHSTPLTWIPPSQTLHPPSLAWFKQRKSAGAAACFRSSTALWSFYLLLSRWSAASHPGHTSLWRPGEPASCPQAHEPWRLPQAWPGWKQTCRCLTGSRCPPGPTVRAHRGQG